MFTFRLKWPYIYTKDNILSFVQLGHYHGSSMRVRDKVASVFQVAIHKWTAVSLVITSQCNNAFLMMSVMLQNGERIGVGTPCGHLVAPDC